MRRPAYAPDVFAAGSGQSYSSLPYLRAKKSIASRCLVSVSVAVTMTPAHGVPLHSHFKNSTMPLNNSCKKKEKSYKGVVDHYDDILDFKI